MLTQKELKEKFYYNPIKGTWTYRIGPRRGKQAGSVSSNGYRYLYLKGKAYRCARLAFLYMEGAFPTNEVDHINREPLDDRWENLRDVTRSENQINTGNYSHNSSGIKGISWHKSKNKWQAIIGIDGKNRHLGYSETLEGALKLRLDAEKEYGWLEITTTPAAKRQRIMEAQG